jgi:cytoskeletal protein CcmA (bactofilin family)
MTISMKTGKNTSERTGAALLVVLFIVMAITIMALGFVSQSDVELACGQNMVIRTKMDYLAESGLEHARGLILNPQDARTPDGYWKGGTNLQLTSGSDFYDVQVDRDANDFCNYIINCNSYRLQGTDKIVLSRLRAELRLDPCIAYWVGSNTTVSSATIINGDVYCGNNLTNSGTINGDVFAVGTIDGINPEGQKKPAAEVGVVWPDLAIATTYYIGSTPYSAEIVDANAQLVGPYNLSEMNRAGIRYCAGNANMPGGATINGTLVVDGNLTVSGENSITAEPNFPAILVGGQVVMKNGGSLVIRGLAQIGGPITDDPNTTNANISATGGLFIANGGVTSDKVIVNVTAAPAIASIETWSSDGTSKRWGPAAGAFYRSIERK